MPDTLISTEALTDRRPAAATNGKSVRDLWNAYQKRWKAVSEAMDECDAAMLARGQGGPVGSTKAEQEAREKLELCHEAFAAASEEFLASPARSKDDAICKVLYVLDQTDLGFESDRELRKALRVFRKLG